MGGHLGYLTPLPLKNKKNTPWKKRNICQKKKNIELYVIIIIYRISKACLSLRACSYDLFIWCQIFQQKVYTINDFLVVIVFYKGQKYNWLQLSDLYDSKIRLTYYYCLRTLQFLISVLIRMNYVWCEERWFFRFPSNCVIALYSEQNACGTVLPMEKIYDNFILLRNRLIRGKIEDIFFLYFAYSKFFSVLLLQNIRWTSEKIEIINILRVLVPYEI